MLIATVVSSFLGLGVSKLWPMGLFLYSLGDKNVCKVFIGLRKQNKVKTNT